MVLEFKVLQSFLHFGSRTRSSESIAASQADSREKCCNVCKQTTEGAQTASTQLYSRISEHLEEREKFKALSTLRSFCKQIRSTLWRLNLANCSNHSTLIVANGKRSRWDWSEPTEWARNFIHLAAWNFIIAMISMPSNAFGEGIQRKHSKFAHLRVARSATSSIMMWLHNTTSSTVRPACVLVEKLFRTNFLISFRVSRSEQRSASGHFWSSGLHGTFFGKFQKFRLEKLPQIIQWILYSVNTTLQTTNHLANQVISGVHRQLQKK